MKCEEFKKLWLEGKELREKEILHLKECKECKKLYKVEEELLFLFENLNKPEPDEKIFIKLKRKILLDKILNYASLYYLFSSILFLSLFPFLIKNINLQEKLITLINEILKFSLLFPFLIKFAFIISLSFFVNYSIFLIFIVLFLYIRVLRKGSIPLLNL